MRALDYSLPTTAPSTPASRDTAMVGAAEGEAQKLDGPSSAGADAAAARMQAILESRNGAVLSTTVGVLGLESRRS